MEGNLLVFVAGGCIGFLLGVAVTFAVFWLLTGLVGTDGRPGA